LARQRGASAELVEANQQAALAASAVLAIGALPHPFSGLLSDRFGRAMPISVLMLLSACCSFAMGWAHGWPFSSLVGLGLVYGILITSESAIVSTGIAEAAEPAGTEANDAAGGHADDPNDPNADHQFNGEE